MFKNKKNSNKREIKVVYFRCDPRMVQTSAQNSSLEKWEKKMSLKE